MDDADIISSYVSRETKERLVLYSTLLKKWNPKINLVSSSTLEVLWSRHMLDSIQFYKYIPENAKKWIDIGSGGGFPGLVLAILAHERKSPTDITLIESDTRKSAFLRTVARETGMKVTVLAKRIEETPGLEADIITSRALADLTTLLGYSRPHLAETGFALLAKGRNWEKEVISARKIWQFQCTPHKSETDKDAVILKIQGIKNVG